ncbi:hypothetical protein BC834DRAFT_204152 [Gloeopeniophorella convolvens]|nr:hypothetical protein BC834DRAFT_204152 [Gloeopeniophorella convolvens]
MHMATLDAVTANFYSAILESCLYGVYVASYLWALYVFWLQSRQRSRSSKLVFAAISTILLAATSHLTCTVWRLWTALFIEPPGHAAAYLDDITNIHNTSSLFLLLFVMIVGDILVIFRLWIIYEGSVWAMALPCTGLAGTIVTAVALSVEALRWHADAPSSHAETRLFAGLIVAFPLVTNMAVAGLVLTRVLRAEHAVRAHVPCSERSSWLLALVVNVIVSSVIYPALLLVFLVLFLARSPAYVLISRPLVQLIGILPTLLWVKVRLGSNVRDNPAHSNDLFSGASSLHVPLDVL